MASIVHKTRVNKLRWNEHVLRREEDTKAVKLVMGMYVEEKRERRLKKEVGGVY